MEDDDDEDITIDNDNNSKEYWKNGTKKSHANWNISAKLIWIIIIYKLIVAMSNIF